MSREKSEQNQPEQANNDKKRKAAPDYKITKPKRRKIQSMEDFLVGLEDYEDAAFTDFGLNDCEEPRFTIGGLESFTGVGPTNATLEDGEEVALTNESIKTFVLDQSQSNLMKKLSSFSSDMPQFFQLIAHLELKKTKSIEPRVYMGSHNVVAIKKEILARTHNVLPTDDSKLIRQLPFLCMMLMFQVQNMLRVYPTLFTFLQNTDHSLDLAWANAIFLDSKTTIALFSRIQHCSTVQRKKIAFDSIRGYLDYKFDERQINEIEKYIFMFTTRNNNTVFGYDLFEISPISASLDNSLNMIVQDEEIKLTQQCIKEFLLEHSSEALKKQLMAFHDHLPQFNQLIPYLENNIQASNKAEIYFGDHNIQAIKSEIMQRTKTLLPNDNPEILQRLPFLCMLLIIQTIRMEIVYGTIIAFLYPKSPEKNSGEKTKGSFDTEWADAIFIGMKESIALLIRLRSSASRARKELIFKKLESYFLMNKFSKNETHELKMWVYDINVHHNKPHFSNTVSETIDANQGPIPKKRKTRKIQKKQDSSKLEGKLELTKTDIRNFLLCLTEEKLIHKLIHFREGLPQFNKLLTHLSKSKEKSLDSKIFFGNHDISAIKTEILQRKNQLMLSNAPELIVQMPFFCMMLIHKLLKNSEKIYNSLRHMLLKQSAHLGQKNRNKADIDTEWADAIFIGTIECIALLVSIQHSISAPKKEYIFNILEDYFLKTGFIKSKVPEIKMWVIGTKFKGKKVTFLDTLPPSSDGVPFANPESKDPDLIGSVESNANGQKPIQPTVSYQHTGLIMQEPAPSRVSAYPWKSKEVPINDSQGLLNLLPGSGDELLKTAVPSYYAKAPQLFFAATSPKIQEILSEVPATDAYNNHIVNS